MSDSVERLRDALRARADLVDVARPPGLPAATPDRRWRGAVALVAAAVVAVVSTVVVMEIVAERHEVVPAPAPMTTSPVSESGGWHGDVDGDGADDRVSIVGSVLWAELSSTGERVKAQVGGRIEGLADVGADRLVIALNDGAVKVAHDGSLVSLELDTYPHQTWVDGQGRLLTLGRHPLGDDEVWSSYVWRGAGRRLTPTPGPMWCSLGPRARPCGDANSFVVPDASLPGLASRGVDAPGIGDGAVSAPGDSAFPEATARLVRVPGSKASAQSSAQLIVNDRGRSWTADLDSLYEGSPFYLGGALRTEAGVVFLAIDAFGDSFAYRPFLFDGESVREVTVDPVAGLTLEGGGPVSGPIQVEVHLTTDGRLMTMRSEGGEDLYQRAVLWSWDGDALRGTDLGVVCRPSLTERLGRRERSARPVRPRLSLRPARPASP